MEGFLFAVRNIAKFSKNVALANTRSVINITANALELLHTLNPLLGMFINSFGRGVVISLAMAYRKNKLMVLDLQKVGRFSHRIFIALIVYDVIGIVAEPLYKGLRYLTRSSRNSNTIYM